MSIGSIVAIAKSGEKSGAKNRRANSRRPTVGGPTVVGSNYSYVTYSKQHLSELVPVP